MDILLIVIGSALVIIGILGCFLPIIPGPPVSFVALLFFHFTTKYQFSEKILVIAAIMAVIVTVLDYIIPIWGTKYFGGSKKGVWGSTIGLIIGLFFVPWGIIVGPFLGAVAGEMVDGQEFKKALKSGFGAFLGFAAGVIIKMGVSVWIAVIILKQIIN
ncbi:MAG: DUF456 domain-containing protein [Bacteroidetes bacterium]|nr:DUF456 domain-containing protein [Bacteroidota bacterium]